MNSCDDSGPVGTKLNTAVARTLKGGGVYSYTVEWGELGRWCELGQNFSESSPLLLLVKGHWCAMGQKFSAL